MKRHSFPRSNYGLECIVESFDLANLFVLLAGELHVFEVVDGQLANDSVLFDTFLLGEHEFFETFGFELVELALLLFVLALQGSPLHLEFLYLLA